MVNILYTCGTERDLLEMAQSLDTGCLEIKNSTK